MKLVLFSLTHILSEMLARRLKEINQVLLDNNYEKFFVKKEILFNKNAKKILKHSEVELENIKLGFNDGYFLERSTYKKKIKDNLSSNKYLFITGKAGDGKSSLTKEFLYSEKENWNIVVFRSEILNKNSIFESFSCNLGIDNFDIRIFEQLSSDKQLIIFVDSIEKLIETESLATLKELITLCSKQANIKMIFTSRTYVFSDILFELETLIKEEKYSVIEVLPFSQEEFKEIEKQYSKLAFYKNNKSIIFRTPFYLNLIITNIDYKEINDNEISFIGIQNILWEKIIKKGSISRESLFTEIALKRAFSMKYDVKIEKSDIECLEDLIKENIIREGKFEGYFASYHDVLEDIALIRYIEKLYFEKENLLDFYKNIDTKEIGKRRALRLWINSKLEKIDDRFKDFIIDSLEEEHIDIYWKDDILISILKSNFCSIFLCEINEFVKKDTYKLLFRIIHLLTVSCQEPHSFNSNFSGESTWINLFPVGSGWQEIIKFIFDNLNELKENWNKIFNFIVIEWSKKISHDKKLPIEANIVGYILLKIFDEIKETGIGYSSKYREKEVIKGVHLLFSIIEVLPNEIESFIKEMNNNLDVERSENYSLYDFSRIFIGEVLKDFYTKELCKKIPDTVIDIAKKRWLRTKKEKVREIGEFFIPEDDSFDINKDFGIAKKYDYSYFPAGKNKTMIRFLLYFHHLKAVKLICDIFNHVTSEYEKSKRNTEQPLVEIEFKIDNNSYILKGNELFWMSYRNTVVFPDVLHSILMAFESYLLEIFDLEDIDKKTVYKNLFEFIVKNCNNIAPISVLTSITLAKYKELGTVFYPILEKKELYIWDLHRMSNDSINNLAVLDRDIPFAQEEMAKSNKLEHRKKTLEYIVEEIQFTDERDNIFKIIDRIKSDFAENTDITIRNIVDRMDIRNWEVDKKINKDGQSYVTFKVKDSDSDKNLNVMREDVKEIVEKQNYFLEIQQWSRKILNDEIVLQDDKLREKWNELYIRCLKEECSEKRENIFKNEDPFLSEEMIYSFYFNPLILAAVGINKINRLSLEAEQIDWCLNQVIKKWTEKISARIHNNSFDGGIGIYDKEILEILPEILRLEVVAKKHKDIVKQLLFLTLIYNIENNDRELIYKIYREEILNIFEEFYFSSIKGIYEWFVTIKNERNVENNDDLSEKRKGILENILKSSYTEKFELKLETIFSDLKEYSRRYLKILLNIFPYNLKKEELKTNYVMLLEIIFSQFNVDKERSFEFSFAIKEHVASVLLNTNIAFSKLLLKKILNKTLEIKNRDYNEFVNYIFDDLISKVDIEKDKKNQFWELNKVLKEWIIQNSYHKAFTKNVFLYSNYWKDISDWEIIHENERYLKKAIEEIGYINIEAVGQIVSGIGFERLIPICIPGVKKSLEKLENGVNEINNENTYYYLEKLIRKTYQNKIQSIKEDYELKMNFIYILNLMIDAGSSLAFIVRERVISL